MPVTRYNFRKTQGLDLEKSYESVDFELINDPLQMLILTPKSSICPILGVKRVSFKNSKQPL